MIRREVLFPEKGSIGGLPARKSGLTHMGSTGNLALPSKQSWFSPAGQHGQRSPSFAGSPTASLRPPPEAYPHRKQDYELLNQCGEGATAKVFRAFCKPLQEVVAVKIVDLESVGNNLDTIIHEAHMMSGLRHKNVLGLLASFVEGHYLWMVLPYICGGSVESAMNYAFPKGLEERVIAPIAAEVLRALEYLHRLGIVHRDVKASNILLGRDSVVLGDFGIAASMERCLSRACPQADFGRYLSRTTFVGTPVWMAPEVIEQSCGHGMKADIYSFGMTLLEMACGQVPYAGMPFEVVALNKLHHPSPTLPATHEGRAFSADMQHVVALCLEADPAKRPTARQLLQHRFFKWNRAVASAVEELLAAVPPPVQRLHSLTRRSKERGGARAEETNAADERVSFGSLKLADAFASTQRFDAAMAQVLLQRMLTSSGVPVPPGGSPSDASSGWASGGSTPRKAGSFSSKRSRSFARGSHWPHLPACALKHCRGILFSSAARKGFGLQTLWGSGFVLAHIERNGVSCWSGPCYVYVTGNAKLGLGENIRESVVLFAAAKVKEKLAGSQNFRINDLQLADAVGDGLDAAGVCELLKEGSAGAAPCEGIAFRHYSGTKAWKNHGIVHLDEAANERVYGKRVSPADILEGRVKPPDSFRGLVDDLIAAEEGRYLDRQSTSSDYGDSDSSYNMRSHMSAPPTPNARGEMRLSSSLTAVASADGLESMASRSLPIVLEGVTAPASVFANAPDPILQRSPGSSGNHWEGAAAVAAALRPAASAPEFHSLGGSELPAQGSTSSTWPGLGGGSPPGGSPRSSHTSGLESGAALDAARSSSCGRGEASASAGGSSPAITPRSVSTPQGYQGFLAAAATPFAAEPAEAPEAAAGEAAKAPGVGKAGGSGGGSGASGEGSVRGGSAAWRPPKPPPRQGSATAKDVAKLAKQTTPA